MRVVSKLVLWVLSAAALTASAPAGASAAASCAGTAGGGEWRTYGHDLANTRMQDAEHTITRASAALLGPVWTFSSNKVGGKGDFVGTPIVADGCVFAGTTGGFVYAVNADTGKLVWRVRLPRGEVNNTVAVADGLVIVGVTDITQQPCAGAGCDGPYVIALDEFTGRTVWRTASPIDFQPGADFYGSPVVYDPGGSARPATRRCVSRRRFRIRLRAPRGQRLVRARVYVNGKRARTILGARRLRSSVDLRGLPRGRFTVRVVARTNRNRRVTETRAYRTCVAGHRARAAPAGALALRDSPMILAGVSGWGAEGNDGLGDDRNRNRFQGSFVILDAGTGAVLKKTWTIHPPAQCPTSTCAKPGPDDQYAGASIWSTAAIDAADKVAYLATGNPFKPEAEHPHANAVLKIDLDRAHGESFGKVVGSYKGSPEQYLPGADQLPCKDTPTSLYACVELDLDFGASPNLITGAGGRKLVGAGQKSGVYHVFDARTMRGDWTQPLSPPGFLVGGIVGSPGYDGKRIYGPITTGGYLWSLDQTGGAPRWVTPLNDVAHYGEPVALANGVVYTVDRAGMFDALDSDSGAFLLRKSLGDGTRTEGDTGSYAGVAIARNTVYAAVGTQGNADGYLIAYRVGGKGSPPPDSAPPLPPGEEDKEPSGSETNVVAGPGAQSTGYATPAVTLAKGSPLAFRNLDTTLHDVTARKAGPDGQPLFRSKRASGGQAVTVVGAEKAPPGSYEFFCSIHPGMTGTVTIR